MIGSTELLPRPLSPSITVANTGAPALPAEDQSGQAVIKKAVQVIISTGISHLESLVKENAASNPDFRKVCLMG